MTEERKGRGGPNPKRRSDDRRGAPPGHWGQPAFEPTDEQRREVRTLAKVCSHDMIEAVTGIKVLTLTRHFRRELDRGLAEAVAAVGAKLLQKALAGHPASMIFFLKTRGKWNSRIELTGPGGGPIQHFDLSKFFGGLTDDQIAIAEPLLESLLAQGGNDFDFRDQLGAGAAEGGEAEA